MNASMPPPLPATTTEILLADRWQRLGAALIDGVIVGVIILPIQIVTGFWQIIMDAARAHESLSYGALFPWVVLGLVVFALVNGYPLMKSGQTWGKKLLSIKIVDLSGNVPSIPQLCGRYFIYQFLGSVPVIGRLASLVNICLIFRADKRCGHDLAAGTRVVEAIAA